MTRNRKLLLGGTAVAIVGVLVWNFFLRSDSLEVSADDIAAELDETGVDGATIDSLDGTWSIVDLDSVFVGYEIDEILAGVDVTVVGVTDAVTGSFVGEGTTINSVDIEADMTALTTDSSFRDSALRTQAIETNDFPTATFSLTEPIDLGDVPAEGTAVTVDAVGDLTIHGVTRSVTIPLEASQSSGVVLVTGEIEVALADYDIATPSAPRVAGVSETALMKLSLAFGR